jgi:hypothetical protein
MKLLTVLLATSTLAHSVPRQDAANDVIDMVESSLGDNKEGRALLITITITEATTLLSTLSAATTTDTACVKTAISSCPAAAARSIDDFITVDVAEPVILTSFTGQEVDVHTIQPTKTSILETLDVDGILHENDEPLSSGTLSYKEVRLDNLNSGCGRSDSQRRPRIVIPSVLTTTKSLTTTEYTTTVYSTTVSFEIPTNYCTNSDYPSTGFFATASVCA